MDKVLTYSTPSKAPFPAEDFYRLAPKEKAKRSLQCASNASQAPCELTVRVGLFFDGTNNNISRDRYGEHIAIGDDIMSPAMKKALPESERSHSNVARLFEAYEKSSFEKGIFPFYIPGVGARFEWIDELTETSEGKAYAKRAEERIIYALVQVVNSVHAALTGKPRFTFRQAGKFAQDYEKMSAKRSYQESTGAGFA